jgi:hypothetical protein
MTKDEYTKQNKDNFDKPVTLGVLLEFTNDFLIPAMSDMVKSANAEQEYNLKVYVDGKLADYTSDIFKRLDKKYQTDKNFKEKVVEILKRNNMASSEEIAFLEGLVQGS